jgi:hypothetical protein
MSEYRDEIRKSPPKSSDAPVRKPGEVVHLERTGPPVTPETFRSGLAERVRKPK